MSHSKYGNRATTLYGIRFHSLAESRRYPYLLERPEQGEIHNLKMQPAYELQPPFKRDKRWIRAITYVGDFSYTETATGLMVVEDVKGVATPLFKLKAKLFQYRYPHIELRVVRA